MEASWEGADLLAITRGQLAAYEGASPQRLILKGDPLMLPPELATPMGLVLHELATNAAKYGAFSVPDGTVELSWKLTDTDGEKHVVVTWRESGGPPVKKPEKIGFGGLLIQRSLPGADVRRKFARRGLVCTIDLRIGKEHLNAALV